MLNNLDKLFCYIFLYTHIMLSCLLVTSNRSEKNNVEQKKVKICVKAMRHSIWKTFQISHKQLFSRFEKKRCFEKETMELAHLNTRNFIKYNE